MKKVDIISNIVARNGEALATPSKGISKVNLSDYLLKSIWDKVWEIRTDSQGTEYIFGKLPVVTKYGITMYSGDGVDVPSLASGLPFDGRTIWYNPDTQQIEVIGGTGGGSGEGVSNFWDLSGIPSWITNSKPKYSYSEIEGTPDLSVYAQVDTLKAYVTLGSTQTITGEKNFTGGLKVNGSPIYYDTEKKYWKLEGDLLVTGGVTMYGSDSSFTPSTIMDALLYDDTTLGINSNRQLYVKGGTSGGGLDITALQNYLTQNSYLNVTSADNRYLMLSGGRIVGKLQIQRTPSNIAFYNADNVLWGHIGFNAANNAVVWDRSGANEYEILHRGNYSSYALPLSGGTISNNGYALILNRESENPVWIQFRMQNEFVGAIGGENGALRFMDKNSIVNTVWHSGNDGSGSGLDADLLDGVQSSGYGKYVDNLTINLNDARDGLRGGKLFNATNAYDSTDASYRGFLEYGSSGYRAQFNSSSSNNLYYRWCEANTWKPWRKVAFEDSNVASATKLQTARTIWGQSFDGTGNVSGDISNTSSIAFDTSAGAPNIGYLWTNTRGMHMDMSGLGTEQQGTNLTLTPSGNIGIGTANPSSKLEVNGKIKLTSWDSDGVALRFDNNSANESFISMYAYLGNSYTFGQTTNRFVIRHNVNGDIFNIVNGNVGIGTVNPAYKLHVEGNSYIQGVSYVANYISFDYKDHSINNEGAGRLGTFDRRGGMVLQFGTNTSYRRFSIIDQQWTVELFYVDDSGNVFANGGITMYSDQRKKTILNHVELSLKQIANAPLIEHYYNSDEKKTTHVGSIAQYWANMNDWFCKLDSEGYYTMEIQNAALASAISIARELDRYENKTDKAIKKLKKRICELEEEVERLKSA